MQSLKKTTYKEVAEHLVGLLKSGEFGPIQESTNQAKDEQNIKRRVYDALNVLVSADVIQREGKTVVADSRMLPSRSTDFSKGVHSMEMQIQQKRSSIAHKAEMVYNLQEKKQLLARLFRRNTIKSVPAKDKIFFPLVGALCSSDVAKTITFNTGHSRMGLDYDEIKVIGDLDMLMHIDFNGSDFQILDLFRNFEG